MNTPRYREEVTKILASMDAENNQDQRQTQPEQQTPQDGVQDIYVLIVREHEEVEDQSHIIESEPALAPSQVDSTFVIPQKISFQPAYAICILFLFIIIASIIFQLYTLLNPPIATVTIIPKSQTVTLSGTLQLGRLLQPITISQSQTVATTGHGHQDARNATGTITFYNGQLNSIFVPAGTVLTGNNGAQIVTDQDASIPASNLPQVGQVTVQAHAINPGSKGNIAAYDINQGCCATAIKAVNTNSFYGGQDQRDFSTVSKQDINKISTSLKSSLALSIQGALTAQLRQSETLVSLPCSPTVTPNHNIGDEAIQVKVTVSETCSAAAYNSHTLTEKARGLLTTQAQKKLAGYSLFDAVTVKTVQATITYNLVFLSFQARGTWIYALSYTAQEHIKELIAGKTKSVALHELVSLPGVERATLSWGDDTRLPKNSRYIHIILFVA